MRHLSKYTSWILYGLLLITVVFFALFYLGGNLPAPEGTEFLEPVYTGLILNFAYIVLGIGLVLALGFAILQFIVLLKDNPKDALSTLAIFAAFALLLVITWFIGSGEPLNLPAYDGADNTYFWLKLTDMWLYSAGFLLAVAIVSICGFSLVKVIRK